MKSVSLSIFGVRVKRPYSREGEPLDQFSDQGDDFFEVLKAMLGTCQGAEQTSDESSQALQVTRLENRRRQLEGLIEAGSYGSESKIRRLGEWNAVQYNKTERDVDLHPFYFLFDIPEGRERGYLLLQSTGSDSVQTLMRKVLHELFVQDFPNYKIHYEPLIPEELLRQMSGEEAKGSEIRFVRHRPPTDLTTLLGRRGTDITAGSIDLVVKFKEDGFWIRAFENAMRNRDGVIELEDMTFRYDSVKVKVKLGGKERTVDLGNRDKLRPTIEITEQLQFRSGNPTFTSMSAAAQSLLADIKRRLERGGDVPE